MKKPTSALGVIGIAVVGLSAEAATIGGMAAIHQASISSIESSKLVNGCFKSFDGMPAAGTQSVRYGDVKVCHTWSKEGAAGSQYLTDAYAFKAGGTYYVLKVTVRYASSAVETGRPNFDAKAYAKRIDAFASATVRDFAKIADLAK